MDAQDPAAPLAAEPPAGAAAERSRAGRDGRNPGGRPPIGPRFIVCLPPALHTALRDVAAAQGRKRAEVMRDALEQYVAVAEGDPADADLSAAA